jgi:hypothetical protein
MSNEPRGQLVMIIFHTSLINILAFTSMLKDRFGPPLIDLAWITHGQLCLYSPHFTV